MNTVINNKESRHRKQKPNFQNLREDVPGPYYDPEDNHIHKWLQPNRIKNFVIEQDPHKEFVYINEKFKNKNGLYCCICHKRRSGFISEKKKFKYINPEDNEIFMNKLKVHEVKKERINNINNNVKQLVKPILYDITPCETKLLDYNSMTYYQKFRYNNPNYKENISFVLHNNKFMTNYYMIQLSYGDVP